MTVLSQLRAGQLAGSQRLDLSCGLTEFPREIFDLADTLEVLNLSGNALSALPDDLHRLHRLRVLFCSDNQFTELPEVVGQCRQLDMVGFKANRIRSVPAESLPPALRWLILTDNLVEALPSTIGQCARMQKLMLAGNRLRALPEEMAACRALELLRVSANEFDALPDWLLSLPRLAWLAFAGNPFDETPEQAALAAQPAAAIDWSGLSLKHKLGEGASGVIHHADWQQADGTIRPVAVKLFKGAVTSDGWPHSEMAACIAAGPHPNLIAVLGRVKNHPEDTPGLVLELVDASFRNLAGPPSLQSCTRDVYGPEALGSLETVSRMAHGIASATAQLHARGVLHGDLYAHNILWNGQGDCLLGDFGAASFLPTDAATSQALQRVEARAFGCLLEELLAHCHPVVEADEAKRKLLATLQLRCTDPDTSARPAFAEIASLLVA
ncbi:leucine-rich repeat-containing protein kinase family protein [Variovorax sp. J2P1-59]|uniref:leucine-rich repeat-containing protein kinase family protein n=1 Tax=Variovorax flavidus TaxID=3053501 RepID=UPI0025757E49|nr:leucine-rich repeat-containing protein kinase family protein [Variovorax sp. J2P1-59]MDM0077964.1 leucine-rich repeat-containing protein kinase family protein [Variovorax sp. J2P1-59]